MKTIKALLIIALLASSAHAKGKIQYDVCAIDGGKLAVDAHFDKRPQASAVADYLEQKNGRHFYVVVEELPTNKADGK
jgi:hypothetical protein